MTPKCSSYRPRVAKVVYRVWGAAQFWSFFERGIYFASAPIEQQVPCVAAWWLAYFRARCQEFSRAVEHVGYVYISIYYAFKPCETTFPVSLNWTKFQKMHDMIIVDKLIIFRIKRICCVKNLENTRHIVPENHRHQSTVYYTTTTSSTTTTTTTTMF